MGGSQLFFHSICEVRLIKVLDKFVMKLRSGRPQLSKKQPLLSILSKTNTSQTVQRIS